MSLTGAFVAHELRTQARSLRFRVLAVVFVALGTFPAGLIFALRGNLRYVIGGATYAGEVMGFLPLLTGVLALLLSADGVFRERDAGTWTTLTLAGVSSAGYLLRRWLSLQVLILPLTAIPFLAAAAFAAAAGLPVDPAAFLGRWLFGVAPVAVTFSTLGLGLGTLGGGGVQTFVLAGAALWGLPLLADTLLFEVRARFASPLGWLDTRSWDDGIRRLQTTFEPDQRWGPAFPQPTSEAGYAFAVAGEQYLARALPALLLAALSLGLAALYLRRTRPDVTPWRIRRSHPLRTYLTLVARLREQAVPDPAPAVPERVTLVVALLVAAAALGLLLDRGRHYEGLARQRYQAETSGWPDPTPTGVLPGRWRLEGRLGPGDRVAVQATGELINQGAEPVRHLSFSLNPELRVESATAGRGRLTLERRWDRLTARLGTPLLPGERREVRFRLSGRPATRFFNLAGARTFDGVENNFLGAFEWHEEARFARELSAFGYSYRVPALSPIRTDLAAADLFPLLRYQSWKTVQNAVPPETFFPLADVEISLASEPGRFLADSCGGVAGPGGGLRSRCRQALAELRVVGGRHRELPPLPSDRTGGGEGQGATVAVLPAHAGQAKLHLGFLARGARMIHEAWPGLGGFDRPVILEWPSPRVHDLHGARLLGFSWTPDRNPFSVTGNLIFLPEADLVSSRVFEPEGLAALVVSARLARQRPAVPEDAFFFSQLFQRLALQRLGLGPESGAVVGPVRTGMEKPLRTPPPEPWESYWSVRFPALVAALENRMGAEALRRALDDFLAGGPGGPRPGTRKELYEALTRHGGPPVARMIDDFLVQGALPEPVLLDVEFERVAASSGGWRATGRVENRGDGEAVCKLVLTTDLSPVETEVRVEGGRSIPFALTTPQRPQGVFLDPDRECHRLVRMMGSPDRAYFRGETR